MASAILFCDKVLNIFLTIVDKRPTVRHNYCNITSFLGKLRNRMDQNQLNTEQQNSNPYMTQQTNGQQPTQYVYTESWMGSSGGSSRQPVMQPQSYSSAQQVYTETQQQLYKQAYTGTQQQPYQQPYTGMQQPFYPQNQGTCYQNTNPYAAGANASQSGGKVGFSIAGLICGILSIIMCLFMIFDIILFGPGLVFSLIALLKKYEGKGMALAGLICSITGACLSIVYMIVILLL